MINRRSALRTLLATACLMFAATAHAQPYPSKPVRIVVPFAPGGVADSSVVENRPGASGNIGTAAVAASAHVYAKLGWETLRDFAPVTKLGDATLNLVAHPSVPANTPAEFAEQIRADLARWEKVVRQANIRVE